MLESIEEWIWFIIAVGFITFVGWTIAVFTQLPVVWLCLGLFVGIVILYILVKTTLAIGRSSRIGAYRSKRRLLTLGLARKLQRLQISELARKLQHLLPPMLGKKLRLQMLTTKQPQILANKQPQMPATKQPQTPSNKQPQMPATTQLQMPANKQSQISVPKQPPLVNPTPQDYVPPGLPPELFL